ncbi:WD40-repeat-containing domain protein [Absidia repens]|uniref:WD40-repeat-containing domain protein n=1 Tax=Absidia repens TaxID=90262 RepID=A0A1X2J232_9FUNG|nr:WD40-repeat-containing domain protein [Absidia repens]
MVKAKRTNGHSKTNIEEKPKTTTYSEDMDTDDLLEQSDILLSTKDKDGNDMDCDQDTDDLLDKVDTKTKTKKGRPTKKTSDDEDTNTSTKGRKKATTTTTKPKATSQNKVEIKGYELERSKQLAQQYPDNYWQYHADGDNSMINLINGQNKLELVEVNIGDQGAITGMTLTTDGQLLATFSTIGSIKLWDIGNEMKLVRKLRDASEDNIEEFYCGQFVDDVPELIVAGGKLKDRLRWSKEDGDNHILPSPIKIFNMVTGEVLAKLEGHDEEILSIKSLQFNGENYYISTSQDGRIIKWRMAEDWITLIESQKMDDELTCMAFTISFLPNCGNKLYDFENGKLLQSFENLYTSYCDCGKVIEFLDESLYWESLKDRKKAKAAQQEQSAWFITRGAELCDDNGISSTPNICILHRLVYPKKEGGKFVLEEIKQYKHEAYCSNSWLVKIATNGRYLLAPTIYGQVFVFNLLSGQLTAILKNHEDVEVRDVIFHPFAPLIFTSGDDGRVFAYTIASSEEDKKNGVSAAGELESSSTSS